MKQDFLDRTGQGATWPEHSPRETQKAIQERGLGGELGDSKGEKLCYGYEVAVHLASQLVVGFRSTKIGRGFAFNEALDALREAGL